ncbi:MAG: xanthine dehydrogenase family protein subunit M [Alphaproteobacteria bacterium]|nr:xanthine dehydrogenase family protein subunit M [Alphaproteobacteria bacterium]
MYDFQYHRPASLADAAKLLQSAGDDGKLMAGGQTLIPTLKQRLAQPSAVIDLGGIKDLAGIKVDGNAVMIGALTTHSTVASSKDVAGKIKALAQLAEGIGDRQVRHCGTIGGSIANNDPAADYPAAVLALNATITTNQRKIAADEFFKGLFETALKPGEIITSVSFPVPEKAAYVKFPNPASRYAIVGVFVARFGSGGTGGGVRVAVTGAGQGGVFRAHKIEEALSKNFSAKAIEGLHPPASSLNGDIHASAEYRSHLIGVMAKRAVAAAG